MTNNSEALKVSGLTARTLVKNILSVYESATEADKVAGAQWYGEARQIATDLAVAHGVSVECAAAVIAHLSPRIHWVRNVAGAGIVLSGADTKGFMSTSVNNAKRAIASDDPISTLNGNKVKAFAANILGDENAVTVDVWALRVAFGDIEVLDKWMQRKGFYDGVAHCYRIAAAKIGITPSALQAITWSTIRGKAN